MKRHAISVAAIAIVLGAVLPAAFGIARQNPTTPLPTVQATFSARPTPIPSPSQGRVPVSLRMADRIATMDGSHPPAATEVQVEFDQRFRLDMTDFATCSPLQGRDSERSRGPCEVGELAAGRLEAETQFPEQGPLRVSGEATAYKTGPRSMLIAAYLGAPVTGFMLIRVKIEEVSGVRYGVKLTATVPTLAGGSGSLTYLGLRFRKGVFSAACRSGRLQSSVTNSLADGSRAAGGSILSC
jgi:hypothetical protein